MCVPSAFFSWWLAALLREMHGRYGVAATAIELEGGFVIGRGSQLDVGEFVLYEKEVLRRIEQVHGDATPPRGRMNEQFVNIADELFALRLYLGGRQEQPHQHLVVACALDRYPEQSLARFEERQACSPARGRCGDGCPRCNPVCLGRQANANGPLGHSAHAGSLFLVRGRFRTRGDSQEPPHSISNLHRNDVDCLDAPLFRRYAVLNEMKSSAKGTYCERG